MLECSQRELVVEPVEAQDEQKEFQKQRLKHISNRIADESEILFIIHGGLMSREDGILQALKALDVMKKDQELKSYPIFVNWHSGGLDAYQDQLANIREGSTTDRTFSKVTMPVELTSDLADGIVSMPSAALLEARRLGRFLLHSTRLDHCNESDYTKKTNGIHVDCPGRNTPEKRFENRLAYPLLLPIRIGTSPLIGGPGKSAWENMKRRTQNPFWLEVEKCEGGDHPCLTEGGLKLFLEGLKGVLSAKRISIIGHSMGTIVADEMIREYPELGYRNIVYMGAAASISDVVKTVIPALRQHADAHFYNLTLLPSNEASEMTYRGFLPSGSLLEWIDEMYESPPTRLDRTMGKWDNLRVVLSVLSDGLDAGNGVAAKPRMTIKVFGSEKGEPVEHGAFNDVSMCFWRESFWDSADNWAAHFDRCKTFTGREQDKRYQHFRLSDAGQFAAREEVRLNLVHGDGACPVQAACR